MPDHEPTAPSTGDGTSAATRRGRIPRWALTVAWIVTLALAVGVSGWAVGLASRQVTDPLPPGAFSPSPQAAPSSTAGPAATPTGPTVSPTTTPSPSAATTPPGVDAATPVPQAGTRPTSSPTVAPPPAATATPPPSPTATPSSTAEPTPSPTATASAAPAPATTRTVSSVGGQASFRFEAGQVTLLWATPASGFEVTTESEGDQVDVRFRSESHESRIRARYEDGAPITEVEERPESS